MNLNLKIWRQKNSNATGQLVDYQLEDGSPDSSFLVMFLPFLLLLYVVAAPWPWSVGHWRRAAGLAVMWGAVYTAL